MNILALDLGTKCGWAVDLKHNGVWDLKPSNFDSAGRRYAMFRNRLHDTILASKPDLIVYEEVRNHRAVLAAQVYGGLMAIVQVVALDNKIEFEGVPVGTIKKHATGNGGADKKMMIAAAIRLFPAVNVLDDNHADALCLLDYATKHSIL